MNDMEERCWRYIVANRQATAKDVALNCDVTENYASALMERISSENWREPVQQSTREGILNTSKHLTCGDRNASYGPPYDNLSDCANLWEAYLKSKGDCAVHLTAEDVAWMMTLVKMTRSFAPGYHRDNYVDAAAYAAIAGECREIEEVDRHTKTD